MEASSRMAPTRVYTGAGASPDADRTCEACRRVYPPKRRNQRFCSESCRWRFHNRRRATASQDLELAVERILRRLCRDFCGRSEGSRHD